MARAQDIYRMRMQSPLWLRLRGTGQTSARSIQDHFRVRFPPVPVLEIAQDLGVQLWDQPELAWPAFLRADPSGANIWLRPGQSETDIRWWVAHMLGHVMRDRLPTEQRASADNFSMGQPVPACLVASNWAAELLAPDWLMRPLVLTGYQPTQLAVQFGVSQAFIDDRLRVLYPQWFR